MGKEKYGRVLQHFEARNKFANKKKTSAHRKNIVF